MRFFQQLLFLRRLAAVHHHAVAAAFGATWWPRRISLALCPVVAWALLAFPEVHSPRMPIQLQISYHTYQGWFGVSGLVGVFIVFSIYYARTRKLFPLYIAHLTMDVVGGLFVFSG